MDRPAPSKATLLRELAALQHKQGDLLSALATLEMAEPASTYSSVDLPRGVSRRTFRERCRAGIVRGAHREGRVWTCAREAWSASHARVAAAELRVVPRYVDDASLAAAAMATAGLRATRRSA